CAARRWFRHSARRRSLQGHPRRSARSHCGLERALAAALSLPAVGRSVLPPIPERQPLLPEPTLENLLPVVSQIFLGGIKTGISRKQQTPLSAELCAEAWRDIRGKSVGIVRADCHETILIYAVNIGHHEPHIGEPVRTTPSERPVVADLQQARSPWHVKAGAAHATKGAVYFDQFGTVVGATAPGLHGPGRIHQVRVPERFWPLCSRPPDRPFKQISTRRHGILARCDQDIVIAVK